MRSHIPEPAWAQPSSGDPRLPGVGSIDAALDERLAAALQAKGPGYRPRTRHVTGGAPAYTNRLILETSPYLLQHAHNPVNWFPWGEAAFERARATQRPILLSVGYSTCHWCHVMERESFEDEQIAAFINERFVPVKVDREERPDVDSIYMSAVRLLSGRGGWPMTLVLTPDRQPFFGGTYFPPRDGVRGARKGLLTILGELAAQYRDDRVGLLARAAEVSRRIAAESEPRPAGGVPGPEAVERAAAAIAGHFEPIHGGFGRAPKFPRPVTPSLLLRYHRRTGDPQALRMVIRTLEGMASGGLYDQVGGGFHRYSTDGRWRVPHFEKMLYDNAQLATLYVDAWQITGRADLERVARETLDYVAREMSDPGGGFWSATDADSPAPGGGHDEEGLFFTWTPAELVAVLGPELGRAAGAWWGVSPGGDLDGRSVLHTERTAELVAAELGVPVDALQRQLAEARRRLYEARRLRPPPLTDNKVLAGWNGLMISAFARGALAFGEPRYLQAAERAADFVLGALRDQSGRLRRSALDGRARHPACLEDYAFIIRGLLDLFEASGDLDRLRAAIALQATQDTHYAAEGGGYYLTAHDAEGLLARERSDYDGAEPSGNSVAASNLLRLATLTGQAGYRQTAERLFRASARQIQRTPSAVPELIAALEAYLDRPREVLIVLPDAAGGADTGPLLGALRRAYLPNRAVVIVRARDLPRARKIIPLLRQKEARNGRPTAYVCEQGRCELPTSDPATLSAQLAKIRPLRQTGRRPPLISVGE